MKKIRNRAIAIFRILTSSNFILIDSIKERKNNQDTRKCRLLRRTDFTNESDFLTLKMAIMANFNVTEIEEKHHSQPPK